MKKNKFRRNDSRGITLIALVITIIVLLILAAVSIATLTGDNGVLTQANNARTETTKQAAKEKVQVEVMGSRGNDGKLDYGLLKTNLNHITGITGVPDTITASSFPLKVTVDGYEVTINDDGSVTVGDSGVVNPPATTPSTVSEAKTKGTKFDDNTPLTDEYGNTVIVPEGFKIANDSAENVTRGVVIEDADSVKHPDTVGSQFVWIPVGTVYTNEEKTTSKTITLGRYEFDSTTGKESAYLGNDYTEDTIANHNSSYGNAIAKDISAFQPNGSVEQNGGYYIGRYEARVEDATLDTIGWASGTAPSSSWTGYKEGKLVVKPNAQVFNYITQNKAAELSKNMYDSNTNNFNSDLMNSYAWDTAIVFLQTFDDRTEDKKTKPYSIQNSLNTGSPVNQGTNHLEEEKQDKICNIWDMASNTYEWTTETSSFSSSPCVLCGGSSHYSLYYSTTYAYDFISFRPLLYL